jgi:hypothetical protein
MSFFDKFKKKAADVAEDHEETIDDGIDKAADFADDKTGGKHTDKIEMGADKAKDFVEDLAEEE